MKREDLEMDLKEKFLFEGLTASGKTWISMRIAKLYAMNGKRVLFIDVEHGTDRDKKNVFNDLSDEELEKVDVIHATDIETYLRAMLGYTEEKQVGSQVVRMSHYLDYDLKICDDIVSEIELYKVKLTQKFIKQGYYTIGEKQFSISNPDTFILPYNFYAKLYDQVKEALVIMLNHRYDIIVTMHPLKDTSSQRDLEQSIYQKFDSVIRLNKMILSSGFPKWTASIVKNRGRESPDKSNMLDSVEPLLVYFIKKFKMDINVGLEKIGMGEKK